jgi:hypothetical protein
MLSYSTYVEVFFYCHNPTNNPKQLKPTFVGVVLLVRKPTTTTPPPHHHHITTKRVSLQFEQF